MYNVPAQLLNQIAPLCQTEAWRQVFSKNQDQLGKELEGAAQALEKRGISPAVILAYQTVCPLLAENEAISKYIARTGLLEIRQLLPEVLSVNEALLLMMQEHNLDDKQTDQLRMLLRDSGLS